MLVIRGVKHRVSVRALRKRKGRSKRLIPFTQVYLYVVLGLAACVGSSGRSRDIRTDAGGYSTRHREVCRMRDRRNHRASATLEQKRRATRLVGKCFLELGKRACPRHRIFVPAIPHGRLNYSHTIGSAHLSQRDKPPAACTAVHLRNEIPRRAIPTAGSDVVENRAGRREASDRHAVRYMLSPSNAV
jgi:hypothetical protein